MASSEPEKRSFSKSIIIGITIVMATIFLMVMLWIIDKENQVRASCSLGLAEYLLMKCPECKPCPPPMNITQVPRKCPEQNCPTCPPIEDYNEIKWKSNWDRKNLSTNEKAITGAFRILVLVRHGKYDYNTGIIDNIGKQQVEFTAQRLLSIFKTFDSFKTSPLVRAKASADIIHAHYANLTLDSDPTLLEGAVPTEPISFQATERQFYLDKPRLEASFREHFYRPEPGEEKTRVELYVGHGNIFRYFLLRALQLPSDAWMRIFLPNASITQLEISPTGDVIMTRFGEADHLPENMISL